MIRLIVLAVMGMAMTGCFSLMELLDPSYELTKPEQRYQAYEDHDPHRVREKLVKTFSVLAPEGQWSFWGPYAWGGIFFRGGPAGPIGKYVGYEVKMELNTGNFRDKDMALLAVKTGNFQPLIDDSLEWTRRWNEESTLPNNAGRPVYRRYSAELTTFRRMTCIVNEGEMHIFVKSNRPGAKVGEQGPGDGVEEYARGFFCYGFHNGEQAKFVIATRILVNNGHVTDGISIDPEMLKAELLQRLRRSLDSLQFEVEFTQVVPAKYQ